MPDRQHLDSRKSQFGTMSSAVVADTGAVYSLLLVDDRLFTLNAKILLINLLSKGVVSFDTAQIRETYSIALYRCSQSGCVILVSKSLCFWRILSLSPVFLSYVSFCVLHIFAFPFVTNALVHEATQNNAK